MKRPTTWKLSIKTNSKKEFSPFDFCKKNSLIGVGWAKAYDNTKTPTSLEEAKKLVFAKYKEWNLALKTLLEKMQPNDHVWIHHKGKYYLCKVGSKVLYGSDIDDSFRDLDLAHCREAKWVMVPDKYVSGSIQRGTIARRTTQQIKITDKEYESHQYLFEKLKDDPKWEPKILDTSFKNKVTKLELKELFAIMTPDDVEDIVSAYLQSRGWILIKSTCFRSKPVFEFSMRNNNNEFCQVQVKSGKNSKHLLAPSDYSKYLSDHQIIYLFSTHSESYPGEPVDDVRCIPQKDLINWLKSNTWVLTDSLKFRIYLHTKCI